MNTPQQPDRTARNNTRRAGFTLVELLIALLLFTILAAGLHQIAATAGSAFTAARNKQELLANGRFAMDYLVAFVQASDAIRVPVSNRLEIAERRLDTYHNATRVFTPDGDGLLDADNNGNRLLNDDELADGKEWVFVRQDTAGNTLVAAIPDYSAPTPWLAPGPESVICEHVAGFVCTLMATNLVQIELTLADGPAEIVLHTRAKARLAKALQ